MKLRFWFLLPARIWLTLLLAAPLAIICVYSALTRGAYGGVSLPATAENYARFFDPLYAAILWRSLLMAPAPPAPFLLLGLPPAPVFSRAHPRPPVSPSPLLSPPLAPLSFPPP